MNQQLSEQLKGTTGRQLADYLSKEVAKMVDVRNIPKGKDMAIQAEARAIACTLIEDMLINKIKVLNGDVEAPDENQYE